MKILLDYLANAEGTEVHYNKGEDNITAPYGIYKKGNEDARAFTVIKVICEKIELTKDTKRWSRADVETFNKAAKGYGNEFRATAAEFYRGYLENSPYLILPDLVKLSFFSIYVNSKKLAMKSLQQAIIDLNSNGIIKLTNISKPDGVYGPKTRGTILAVNGMIKEQAHSDIVELYFESLMLSNMKSAYIDLAVSKPKKFLRYLSGWDNRMNKLLRIR